MRYLFCSLNSYGFLQPAMGIALELVRRGHETAFVTDVTMQGALERAGLTRIARGDPDGQSFLLERAGDPMDTIRQVRHIERAAEQFSPDVIVGQQLALGPPIAAERLGLPLGTIGLASYLWPAGAPAADAGQRAYTLRRYRGFFLAYLATREMYGMPGREAGFEDSPLIGDLFLLRSVPELEHDAEALPRRVHWVGDLLWEPEADDPALLAFLRAARAERAPVIYIQPGRAFETRPFWRDLVEALRGEPVCAVASVGRMKEPIGEMPANLFARPHVPQSLVLPWSRAVLSSGTTTSVLGALAHGLPLILIPGGGGAEQVDLTRRCLRARVAVHLSSTDVTVEVLRAQIRRLCEESHLHERARVLQAAFAAAGGIGRAADLLEQLGRERAPILRLG